MFIINDYPLAVFFCFITMLCWGSWANTQKLAEGNWRFELFYWDYVLGIVLLSLVFGLTLGSIGEGGRSFLGDLSQAAPSSYWSALAGGAVFNLANILIVAAISLSGMAVAFPVGIGLALVLGVMINFISEQKGDPVLLFIGVALVTVAIILDALAYKKNSRDQAKNVSKGLKLALIGGVLMSFFYFLVQQSMSLNFQLPEVGKFTPYSAVFVFSLGIFLSNFIFNTILMKKPVDGTSLTYGDYFSGSFKVHLVGILGGAIWCIGMAFSIIASEQAGPAISYGLGQGATMVAAFWGVFVWKEFKGATTRTQNMLRSMFACFIIGIIIIIYAGL
ncbi:GRP family sugar transporter [Cyclobacterium marinum]|uniref:Putative integral membrane protein putative sugar permease n=1 Tax=Cyclobacterium marinum (strain ATCC 25205 / DSM 745 / LMG 13164 / NCIMB 1802) TaxID=880070 RepID=G0J736_CYCMS|nr:GRP family sugar transporter [Cyclobacterium marinum]AEL26927.1 putative integral membrane protein; putative sugar permease [Cyclobacterium marinum DSM 745]